MNVFNLLEEKWIPCQLLNGENEEFGIFELLARASDISTLTPEMPMEKVSLMRLLLAILHRNFGPRSTSAWWDLWNRGEFDMQKLGDYFKRWEGRFNLFDQQFPFFQTREIDTKALPLNNYSYHLAFFHLASGNNATLFDHHTNDSEVILSAAQAAILIINAQSFAFGFLTFKDGPSARGVNFILLGENLFQTLVMNLIRYDENKPFHIFNEDMPFWEWENPFMPKRTKPAGYLDYLTWPCRKILLHPDEHGEKVLSWQVDNGLRLDIATEPFLTNPMMQYSKKDRPAPGSAPYRPLKFEEGRAIWRDSTSIMSINSEDNKAPQVLEWMAECKVNLNKVRLDAIGISSDQGKVNFYREELFTFPAVYLENANLQSELKTCLEQAEEVRKSLWVAVNQMADIFLAPNADFDEGRNADKKEKQALMDHLFVENHYWAELEIPFYQLLNTLPLGDDSAMDAWENSLRETAWFAFNFAADYLGFSPEALKARAKGGRVLGGRLKEIFKK